jgi:hypothetical protein
MDICSRDDRLYHITFASNHLFLRGVPNNSVIDSYDVVSGVDAIMNPLSEIISSNCINVISFVLLEMLLWLDEYVFFYLCLV